MSGSHRVANHLSDALNTVFLNLMDIYRIASSSQIHVAEGNSLFVVDPGQKSIGEVLYVVSSYLLGETNTRRSVTRIVARGVVFDRMRLTWATLVVRSRTSSPS
jgi:hypothetical protein